MDCYVYRRVSNERLHSPINMGNIMMYKKTTLLCVLGVVGSCAQAQSVNISNPGFENNFDDWREYESAAVSGDERSGSKAAKLQNSSGQLRQRVSVEPYTDYELVGYIKGGGRLGVNTGSGTKSTKISDQSSYALVTVNFTSEGADTVDLFLKYYDSEGRFDDISLTRVGGGEVTPEPEEPSEGSVVVPAKIEAEDYVSFVDDTASNIGGEYRSDAVDIQTTDDSNGGYNVGWFNAGEVLDYDISVSDSDNYLVDVRVATVRNGAEFALYIDGNKVGENYLVPNNGNWQSFSTIEVDLGFLTAGDYTLSLKNENSNFNVNWLDIRQADNVVIEPPINNTCNIDMSIWGYTLSDGKSRNNVSDIQDLVDNKTLGDDEIVFNEGCVTFKAPNIGTTSSGSSFVRSELRELVTMYNDSSFDDTDIENQWVTSKASSSNKNNAGGVDGKMTSTLSVNTVSVDYNGDSDDQVGRIIVGQIHGVDHEPVKIYYQKMPDHSKGSVYFTVDGSNGKPIDRVYVIGYSDKDYEKHSNGSTTLSNPSNGIALGEQWSYEIDLSGDQLRVTVWHDGNIYTTADSIAYSRTQSRAMISNDSDSSAITIGSHYDNDFMYFKAGLYNQNNTGTESPNYAEVTFYQIDVEHY